MKFWTACCLLTFWAMMSCDSTGTADCELTVFYRDSDGDGFGLDYDVDLACEKPDGFVAIPGDCDDNDATIFASVTLFADVDGDGFGDPTSEQVICGDTTGFVTNNNDCNDRDASISSGLTWYEDQDGDGWGNSNSTTMSCSQPQGYVATGGDIDDSDPTVNVDCTVPADFSCDASDEKNWWNGYYHTEGIFRYEAEGVAPNYSHYLHLQFLDPMVILPGGFGEELLYIDIPVNLPDVLPENGNSITLAYDNGMPVDNSSTFGMSDFRRQRFDVTINDFMIEDEYTSGDVIYTRYTSMVGGNVIQDSIRYDIEWVMQGGCILKTCIVQ